MGFFIYTKYMKKKMKKNYYAIIPAEVRYSNITANAKLLYGEITALSNEKGYCWANNKYFADLYGVSTRIVSTWVNLLEKNGFIISTVKNNRDRKIVLASMNKTSTDVGTKVLHNITYNNKDNNDEQSSSPQNINTDSSDVTTTDSPLNDSNISPLKDLTKQSNELISYYIRIYTTLSGKQPIITARARYIKQAKPFIKAIGLFKMKELLIKYLKTDDKFFEENNWSLSLFLTDNTINKLK